MGDDCLKLRHQLDISYPVNNGIVQNWDDMGNVWDHAFFNELKVAFSTANFPVKISNWFKLLRVIFSLKCLLYDKFMIN